MRQAEIKMLEMFADQMGYSLKDISEAISSKPPAKNKKPHKFSGFQTVLTTY